ncbi:hypothetical protein Y1Q_0006333 [Alligator mississippiensis]|uniref:Uncharacterized protein n=1 Tax=Alligator mississippiensis TaxID=8496 RepID=A0A151NXT7_ALLMI|nr:hypothetical protein Y1Q_0006333 [Alligator mississippiensis]
MAQSLRASFCQCCILLVWFCTPVLFLLIPVVPVSVSLAYSMFYFLSSNSPNQQAVYRLQETHSNRAARSVSESRIWSIVLNKDSYKMQSSRPWIRNENQIYMCRACISILGITTKQLPLLFGCFIPSGPERWHAAAAVLKLKIFFPYFFKPFEK